MYVGRMVGPFVPGRYILDLHEATHTTDVGSSISYLQPSNRGGTKPACRADEAFLLRLPLFVKRR